MKRLLTALAAALWLVSPASSQTINNLGNAGAVSGTDYVPIWQGANPAKKATASQLGTYINNLLVSPPAIGGTTPAAGTFTNLTATGSITIPITGSTQCLHVNSSGQISGTGSDCGSGSGTLTIGSTPIVSGADQFLLYNNAGVLANQSLSNLLASPPAIGGTLPAAGAFTSITATGGITTNVTGSTQCLQVNSSGVISGTGSACGGSGSTGANPTATASDVAVNGVASTFMRSDAAPAIQKTSASQFGLAKVDGITIVASGGVISSGSTVAAGTTQTVTSTQWNSGTTFRVTTAGQTLTLPVSSTLSTNGGLVIQTVGQSVTLAPNAADAINGGSAGVSVTIASGLSSYITTDGAGNISATPTTNTSTPGGSSGQIQYNNSGAFGGLTNAAVRSQIGVDSRVAKTNTNTSLVAGEYYVSLGSSNWTVPATYTLPAVSTVNNGGIVEIADDLGKLNGQTLTIAANGGDTLLGTTALNAAGGRIYCRATTASTTWTCWGGIPNGTSGQVFVGQGSTTPGNWVTLSGDVSSVTNLGVVTLGKVNGVTFPNFATQNTIPYATALNTMGAISAVNNAVVATNSSGVPAETITPQLGIAATSSGTLALANGGAGGKVITIKNSAATAADFNWNLPATAGTSGQPLLSGGGGSTAMTWGSLSGNTSTFATTSGALTSGHVAAFDASGNIVDSGGSGTGTVNNCTTAKSLSYYSATGTAVDCLSSVGTSGQILTSNGAGAAPTWQSAPGGGNVSNTGTPTNGQIAQFTNATTIQGINTVPKGSGGTGATGGLAAAQNLSVPYIVCSGQGTNFTGTASADKIIAQCAIPGNSIGTNGRVRFACLFARNTGGAGTNQFKMFISATNDGVGNTTTGTQIGTNVAAATAVPAGNLAGWFANHNATNSQVLVSTSTGGFGGSSAGTARLTASLDTTATIYVQFVVNLANSADSGNCDDYYVEILPTAGN